MGYFSKLSTSILFAVHLTSAHLAAYTDGMFCPDVIPWANWQNSTGYYADGKEYNQRPIPYSVTNQEVVAEGLVTSSKGLASPNLHAANKTTAAGTAIAISYKSNVWEVTMDTLVVISTAPQTPFERLANYSIPDLAPCEACVCVTG
ncbi:hypothetical protein N7510_008163 [Penicillium lagena]|uniref:uncharacterized protein n=1 Tax=Penicillium lagena TaxID=94218 RepID=UPI0025401647|nr:uncharacterized protein N7510_008163 [Penicillium lagena]KAJ5605382.1 hypothetical protein N7510_008163 [Penicillium lagena]